MKKKIQVIYKISMIALIHCKTNLIKKNQFMSC